MSLPATPPDNSAANADLMKSVLTPLLEDFQHWFGRTLEMMETRNIGFLSAEQQQDLVERVRSAQKQVSASQMLASATEGQATISMPIVMSWNKLVHECWGVSLRSRKEEQLENKPTEGTQP
jgi:Protein of unknown function (DUF2605)